MYKVKSGPQFLMAMMLCLSAMMPATAELPRDLPINVSAERGDYDTERGATHLRENVRITRGSLEVLADEGYAHRAEGRYQRVELFGSPATWKMTTEEGGEATGQADKIVYELESNRVVMTGNARVRDNRGSFSGNRVVYDLENERAEGDGGIELIIEPEAREPDDT